MAGRIVPCSCGTKLKINHPTSRKVAPSLNNSTEDHWECVSVLGDFFGSVSTLDLVNRFYANGLLGPTSLVSRQNGDTFKLPSHSSLAALMNQVDESLMRNQGTDLPP